MSKYSYLVGVLVLTGVTMSIHIGYSALEDGVSVGVITNCSGMKVTRVAPGRFEVSYIAPDTLWCINNTQKLPMSTGSLQGSSPISDATLSIASNTGITLSDITNCTGTRISSLSRGGYVLSRVAPNLPGCISTHVSEELTDTSHRKISSGSILDLTSTDIVHYRIYHLREQGVRFANALRSVRMRARASRASRTNAYLMRNDAVTIEGKETGWVKVQGAELSVTDAQENTITAKSEGKADGYTASKYLRDPDVSDLVRIEQADHAYWSDLAHVMVRYANIRSNPWYTAPIVTTLGKGYSLYVVTTVDNWSEVRNDEGSVRGYIRSDLLSIDMSQRVDTSLGVR